MPEWLRVWWSVFGGTADLSILSVRNQEDVIGLAPLQIKGDSASFIGGTDVCDYLDFIVKAGTEGEFFDALLNHLDQQGIRYLELGLLRPDSPALSDLVKVAENRGGKVSTTFEDITLELELPATWEDYLVMLNGKQRHEVKRKFRRLYEAGDINFRVVEDANEIAAPLTIFFELFKISSNEKEVFMTDQMISFFQSLAIAMARSKILKLHILELNAAPVAMTMCFDFNATLHLYNSGFDPRFGALSVGLLCKVLGIKDAIKRGRKKFDFLKGSEAYKYRLGGREVSLYNCKIEL
ncbi:MAG: GNAT family N-acetyltransferase [Desulfobacterales bacterium]|nr:MAG: GNAT family N-acetyltransferase [Desulfobacterales bacterium]